MEKVKLFFSVLYAVLMVMAILILNKFSFTRWLLTRWGFLP